MLTLTKHGAKLYIDPLNRIAVKMEDIDSPIDKEEAIAACCAALQGRRPAAAAAINQRGDKGHMGQATIG